MATTLFISSAAEDDSLARAIRVTLNESRFLDVQTRFMSAEIRSGADWADSIREALCESDQALFLVTPNYVSKPWFFMEWAGAWIQGKPAHVLLFNVALAELPEVMRQAEVVDVNHLGNVARLLGGIGGLETDDPGLTAVAGELLNLGRGSQASWDDARWGSICRSVDTGIAVLSTQDLTWVVESGRGAQFVDFLRTNFAHPTLMQQVATFLSRSDLAESAVRLVEMLDAGSQARIFRTLVEEGHADAAAAVGSRVETSEGRRQIAEFALQSDLFQLVSRIGEQFEQGRDKRGIALALLEHGYMDEAVAVMGDVDTNHDRRKFAIACIGRREPDLAVAQIAEMTVGREIRLVAVALMVQGYENQAIEVASGIDQQSERRNFAKDAIQAGKPGLAVRVASTMTVGSELRKVATLLYRENYRVEALGVARLIKRSEDKRGFAEDCLAARDREALVEVARSMDLSSEKRLLAELLAEIGRDEEAIAVAGMIDVDDEAVLLFWAAASRAKWRLARRALQLVKDEERHARLGNELEQARAALEM